MYISDSISIKQLFFLYQFLRKATTKVTFKSSTKKTVNEKNYSNKNKNIFNARYNNTFDRRTVIQEEERIFLTEDNSCSFHFLASSGAKGNGESINSKGRKRTGSLTILRG